MDYKDFVIRFQSASSGEYSAQVSSPAGETCDAFRPPECPGGLEAIRTELRRQAGAAAASGSSRELDDGEQRVARADAAARELGHRLFTALFTDPILELYLRSLEYLADEDDRALRIKLSFDPSSPTLLRLCGLPWELLYRRETREFLAKGRRTPVVRHLELPRRLPRPAFEPPLRILVVGSNPLGTPALDLQRELKEIGAAWRGQSGVEVVSLPRATPQDLREVLPCHILHFMGHGSFEEATGRGALLLETPEGEPDRLLGDEFVNLLRDHPSLQLVVLNACLTGKLEVTAEDTDPFAGVATALMMAEVPAVVAMQLPISDSAAIGFSRTFYQRMAAGDPVDAAMVEGRQTLFAEHRRSLEWMVPVLFTQLSAELPGFLTEPLWLREWSRVREALEKLSRERFEKIRRRFDLRDEVQSGPDERRGVPPEGDKWGVPPEGDKWGVPPEGDKWGVATDTRSRAEKLLSLAIERGETCWIELQESILGIRSPFNPFEGSLRWWKRRPEQGWQLVDGELMGLGQSAMVFPEAPEEIRKCSLLTWEGLRFRDGSLQVRLRLPTLGDGAAAGLTLRHREERGLVLGLLRSTPEGGARAEIWQREGLGLKPIASQELPQIAGDDGWHELSLKVVGRQVELRADDLPPLPRRLSADLPAGHLGLVRFGGTSVRVRDLRLTVWPRNSASREAPTHGVS